MLVEVFQIISSLKKVGLLFKIGDSSLKDSWLKGLRFLKVIF